MEKAEKKREWIIPFSILIAIITALCTTQFKDFLGFKGENWKMLYIFFGILMGYWFIKSRYSSFMNRRTNSLEYIVDKIRNIEEETQIKESARKKRMELIEAQMLKIDKAMLGLIILEAKYGKKGKYIDVDEILEREVHDNKLNVTVENKLFPEDPVPNVVKELIVTYSYNGQNKTITIPEHGVLHLP